MFLGGTIVLWLSLLAPHANAQDCGDLAGALADAEQLVIGAMLDDAREALDEAEQAFGCGAVAAPEALARSWLIEGAVETFAGDREAASDAFKAASSVAPSEWIPSLGDKLRLDYDAAAASTRASNCTISADGAPEGAFVAIDASVSAFPAQIECGLHLVQVGRSAEDIQWAKVVYLPPAQAVTVRVTRFSMLGPAAPVVAATEEIATTTKPPRDDGDTRVFAHLALGAFTAFGEENIVTDATGTAMTEPTVKLLAPLELGFTLRTPGAWVRTSAGAAPMLGGLLLFDTVDGPEGWPFAVFGHVGAGVSKEGADLGLLGGVSLPGRIESRLVLGAALGSSPVRAELRAGVNLPTERSVEPAMGLLLAWDPSR